MTSIRVRPVVVAWFAASVCACASSGPAPQHDGGYIHDASGWDVSTPEDSGMPDTSISHDAGMPDTSISHDAGPHDAGEDADAAIKDAARG